MAALSYTYSIVEAASDTFAARPYLPLARLAVPRAALVVPPTVPEGVIEAVERLAMDRHRNETGLRRIGDPQLNLAIIARHCNLGGEEELLMMNGSLDFPFP